MDGCKLLCAHVNFSCNNTRRAKELSVDLSDMNMSW